MSKIRPQGPAYATEPPRQNLGHGRASNRGTDWVSHGGRRIASGPEPGSHGISRSDGPDAAGSGRQSDLRGKPRRPR
jgi:hypothetical protein